MAYVGQPVAVVVGETRAEAEDAADRVEVDYEVLPGVVDPRAGTELSRWEQRAGDVAGAFARAAHVVRTEHVIPRLAATPMETRGALALREDERLTVWSSSQSAHRARAQLAQVLGLDERAIRVIVPDVGGAFGSKGTLPVETPLVALAALELQRPVKWIEDRRENLVSAPHGRGQRASVELAFDADGRDPRPARAHPRRPRRLPAAEHGDPAAHHGDAAERLLRHPRGRGDRHRRTHQQGADRALSRRRAAGGDLPDRDHDGRRRARARDRCARPAPAQPRALVPLQDRARLDIRLRRLRALPRHGTRAPRPAAAHAAVRAQGPPAGARVDGRPGGGGAAHAGLLGFAPAGGRAARCARRRRRRAVRRALGRAVRARDRAA